MKNRIKFSVVVFSYFVSFVAAAQMSDEEVYQKALKSTFTIKTDKGLGTGFIFGNGQTLLTNYHVIAGATKAVALPSGNSQIEYDIEGVIAADEKLDVAVLKIQGTYRLPLVAAKNKLRVAEKVFALGSPRGLEATFTSGMVSALREGYVQHTAPIAPGSSGGPLLNTYGEVVGMNTMLIKDSQNLNFAVPTEIILSVMTNEFEIVSIAKINEIFGTSERKTTDNIDHNSTTTKEKTMADIKPLYYITFDNGNTPHEALMLVVDNTFKVLVRYKDLTTPDGFNVIIETCDFQLTDAYDASQKWLKMACTDPVSIKKGGKTSYTPDTFWINKESNKMLLSDGQKDSKGNLLFVPVTSQQLNQEDLEKLLPRFK